MDDVRTALAALGIVATGSSEAFTSVGYIQFSDGEYFTTATALSDEQTIESICGFRGSR